MLQELSKLCTLQSFVKVCTRVLLSNPTVTQSSASSQLGATENERKAPLVFAVVQVVTQCFRNHLPGLQNQGLHLMLNRIN